MTKELNFYLYFILLNLNSHSHMGLSGFWNAQRGSRASYDNVLSFGQVKIDGNAGSTRAKVFVSRAWSQGQWLGGPQ